MTNDLQFSQMGYELTKPTVMPRPKLVSLTNLTSPYKLALYSHLRTYFDVVVYTSGMESKRGTWNAEEAVPGIRVSRSWGVVIPWKTRRGRGVFDTRYLHITPGYCWDLYRSAPDAIVSSEMGIRSVIALAYGALFKKPVWIWWGGTLHTESKNGWLRKRFRMIFARFARHWISYGTSSTEYLTSLGIRPESILQIQNCVDSSAFRPQGDALWQFEVRPVALCVSQFVGRKGLDHLLLAASAVQKEGYSFSLLLLGSGPEGDNLRRLSEQLELKNVHFIPDLGPRDMPAAYRSCDFFVFPTLEDVWGLVVNEAMLSGLPVICSKYAGCAAEIVSDEYIFDPTDIKGFSDLLRSAVGGALKHADPRRLKSMAEVSEILAKGILSWLKAHLDSATYRDVSMSDS